jgi:hypothetical protein
VITIWPSSLRPVRTVTSAGLMVGPNRSKARADDISHYGEGIGTEIPHLEDWNGTESCGHGGSVDFCCPQIGVPGADCIAPSIYVERRGWRTFRRREGGTWLIGWF